MTAKLVSAEVETQAAGSLVFQGIAGSGPLARVPAAHRASAMLTVQNFSLETRVRERMVRNVNCKSFLGRIQARPLGHSPTFEHAVEFQPEVVM